MNFPPPIAVFCYNRPNHLKVVLDSLQNSMNFYGEKFPLYIFCDGPQEGIASTNIEKTRKVALEFPNAQVILREKNLKFQNIVDGITTLTDQYGKVIVIEDDVVVSPDFLFFMVKALNHYENNEKVYMVSGFMYEGMDKIKTDTFFLPSAFIWGWGTWKRAWQHFSWNPEGWENFVTSRKLRKEYDYFHSFPFSKMLKKAMKGEISSWAAPWMYSMYQRKAVGLYPKKSLVYNCGTGGGTNGDTTLDNDPSQSKREFYIHGNSQMIDFDKPRWVSKMSSIEFPNIVATDRKAMRYLAISFLKERESKEKRKLKLIIKQLRQKILLQIERCVK